MRRSLLKLRKYTMLLHRWMGVVFCLLFLMWFASGIVMMYSSYPVLTAAQRLTHLPVLNPALVRVQPDTALSLAGIAKPEQVVLSSLEGRPVYRVRASGRLTTVFADTGSLFGGLDGESAKTIAATWAGLEAAKVRSIDRLNEEDQWTVPQKYRPYRPLWKVTWPTGEQVYVSNVTGEVVQVTTRTSRLISYFGAIPHWIYFTQLRKDAAKWNAVVIWLSVSGAVMTLLGIIAGLWLYSPAKKYRFASGPSYIPYSGQKRWHLMLGLIFGLSTFTWILSGMFSMSVLKSTPDPIEAPVKHMLTGGTWHGKEWQEAELPQALTLLSHQGGFREIESLRYLDRPVYLATDSPATSALVFSSGTKATTVQDAVLTDAVARAISPYRVIDSRVVRRYETYYVDRHGEKPLPALYLQTDSPSAAAFYIDLRTGRLVQTYTAVARWNRWLYHGLHSLDLPILYRSRPLWDAIILLFMGGGIALSWTGVTIGYRRVRSKLVTIRKAH